MLTICIFLIKLTCFQEIDYKELVGKEILEITKENLKILRILKENRNGRQRN